MGARGALSSRCRASCARMAGSMGQTPGEGPKVLTLQILRAWAYYEGATVCRIILLMIMRAICSGL